MAKRDAPKQNKGGDNTDRKNGKAWKKNPKQNPKPTGRTDGGYTMAALAERFRKRSEIADSSERV